MANDSCKASLFARRRRPRGLLGGIAEFERGLIRKRTDEGIERAKKQGKKFGRPERLDASQKRAIAGRSALGRQGSA
jgi:DNA invertase Pin-like site-specific DNA recombinase